MYTFCNSSRLTESLLKRSATSQPREVRMITNPEQYELTQVHANNFVRALEKFNEYSKSQKDLHPIHEKAVRDSLTSQL